MLRKLVEPARTTVAQALGLRPMFTAGLGNLAPPSSTLHCCQASHYSRLQSHCCPCEPTLCSSVVTSQALQPPLQKTQWENFSVSASSFILNPTSICTLWAYMSHIVLLLTQWWRDQGQGGPHVPWCSHISVCFMNVVPVSVVLACTLEHECPWETKKMMKITSKPWPERPQPPAPSCWYPQTLSVEYIGNVRHCRAMQMLLNSLIKRQRVVERL